MSWKGGRGKPKGYGGDYGKPEPFVIFPEITLPDPKSISTDSQLVVVQSYFTFNKFWMNSPYHLCDGGVSKKEKASLDIERPDNFSKELVGDTRREQRPVKRAKWSQEADLQKLDVFEKLESKFKTQGNEEKEDGEDDEQVVESEGEESDNGDYDQNQDFDDDEDDYNHEEDGGFEEVY
ncbi:unnamed protein product [Arabidopsis thaliana]|nr:DNA-directed RNA polymerase III subunit [Arabidopsis thaliana]ANM67426.1 DNA-directed RNA polymerase III subunit [Arabidopsis thaliana]VYS65003.1 unnamed protein product [Arabidopsis thaliana]|eukprot:NP_195293.2 DNA-directed RNA polymerase III subunit [Arabidopsis thaliana]